MACPCLEKRQGFVAVCLNDTIIGSCGRSHIGLSAIFSTSRQQYCYENIKQMLHLSATKLDSRSFLQRFHHLFQEADDGKMLRAGTLTLATLYACRGFLSPWAPVVFITCLRQIAIHLVNVHHGENLGDVDIHGTARRAIVTGRTCDVGILLQ